MKLKTKAALFFLIGFIFSAVSNVTNSEYYFRNMAVEDGLSQNMVYSIMQDKTGFIWFGTLDGLNRYDGLRFKIFKRNNEDHSSIGSNKIISLLQDANEKIWVGTTAGIYIYDPHYENFSRFDKKTDQGESVNGLVRDLKVDAEGNIWMVVQDKGVFCLTIDEKLVRYPLENMNLRKMEFDYYGNVWVATYGRGLLSIDPKSSEVHEFLIDEKKKKISENYINTILSVNSNYLLVGTVTRGVQKFNLKEKTFAPFLEKGHDGHPLFVRCMIKTKNQGLWIGTEEGIFIYDLKTMEFVNLRHFHNDPFSISDNAIHSLYQDREGGIWIGTFFGGVSYFNDSFSHFEKYYPIIGKNSISGKSISEFCEDGEKNIWIGTEDAGLNKFNPATKVFTKSPVPSKNIHSLLYDNNKLWIGTFSDGLYIMNLLTQKVTSYKNSTSANSIKDDNIYSIYKDSSGKIWIGSMTGLQYYDQKADNFKRVREHQITSQVNDILEDYKGIVWFATIGDGLFSYDRFSDEWQHYSSQVDIADDSGKSIICLLQDKKNRLWIGTEGAGLCRFDPEKNSFSTVVTSNSGLPNDVIYKLIEDSNGYIWGSTNKGLFRLDSENLDVRIYTHSNGLLGDQFNYKSGFKGHDGKLYFGGVKGFVAFIPNNLKINEYIPPVVLNSFQVQNKEVSLTDEKKLLNKSITYANTINIPYHASIFSIGFAALSYIYPNGNRYAYKLEGRDNDWIEVDQTHQVNYSDLSPGHYVFKVKGANSDGVWNEEGISLKINILPPWYRTFWAYLFYFLMISALVYYSIHRYVQNAKHRNELLLEELENTKEKEIYEAKIEFFTQITHEIRTPLSLIKIPLEEVMKDMDKSDTNWENLIVMQRNVDRLLKLVNELMDFRKTEAQGLNLNFIHADVISLIRDVINEFKPSIDAKGISFSTFFSSDSFYADVDREIFTKILSNLFSNALKHSLHTIEVNFSYDEKNFELKISNDGDTIPDQFVDKIFDPFFKLNKNILGTGIGLALVKSLVELHKGIIYCNNSEADTTTFVMILPRNQEYMVKIEEDYPREIEHDDIESSVANPTVYSDKTVPIILAIDDNEEFLQFLTKQLSKKYRVIQGRNGLEALNIMDKENIDIVICDIMMPQMDGLEFCKMMKTDLKYSHIPIILLTAKTNLESKIDGLNYGADEYIEKPYSIDYLMARIENLLENRRKIREAFRNSPELAYQSITYSKTDEEFLQKLIDIIHKHLDAPDLDIDKLSQEMAMSRATLYRKIKNVSELSPNDFILLIRLNKAAELLKQKKYQINEIAYMVGFNSPNYFSKCFYKQFGVLPKDF